MYNTPKNTIATITDRLAECSLPLKKRKSLLRLKTGDNIKKSYGPFQCKKQDNLQYCTFCSKYHDHFESHEVSHSSHQSLFTSRKVAHRLTLNAPNLHSEEELFSKDQECQSCKANQEFDSLCCKYCPMTFRSDYDWYVHSKLVHCTCRPFHCKICQQSFKLKSSLLEHEMFHINRRKMFKCHRCQMVFTQQSARNNLKSFLCSPCSATLESELYAKNNVPYECTNQFICDICTRSYKNKISLRTHIMTHMSNDLRKFECRDESCMRRFEDCTSLRKHLGKSHLEYYSKKTASYTCIVCNEVFKNYDILLQHKENVHADLIEMIDDGPEKSVKFCTNEKLRKPEPVEESNSTTHFVNGTLHLNENDGSFVIVGKRAKLPESKIVGRNAEILRSLSKYEDQTKSTLKDTYALKGRTLKSEQNVIKARQNQNWLSTKTKRRLSSKEGESNCEQNRRKFIKKKRETASIINFTRGKLMDKKPRIRNMICSTAESNGKPRGSSMEEKSLKRAAGERLFGTASEINEKQPDADDHSEKARRTELAVKKIVTKGCEPQRKNCSYRHKCGFCCEEFKYVKDMASHILDIHNVRLYFHICTDDSCKN